MVMAAANQSLEGHSETSFGRLSNPPQQFTIPQQIAGLGGILIEQLIFLPQRSHHASEKSHSAEGFGTWIFLAGLFRLSNPRKTRDNSYDDCCLKPKLSFGKDGVGWRIRALFMHSCGVAGAA